MDLTRCIQTYSGRWFDLGDPKPEMVDPLDIANALANTGRFSGHTRAFYSVAQHSVLVALAVAEQLGDEHPHRSEAMRWALLHDAHEAYTGDFTRPLKRAMVATGASAGSGPLGIIQSQIDAAVRARFGLGQMTTTTLELVKRCDTVVLATERRDVMAPGLEWGELADVEPMAWGVRPLGPVEARSLFGEIFGRLHGVEVPETFVLREVIKRHGAIEEIAASGRSAEKSGSAASGGGVPGAVPPATDADPCGVDRPVRVHYEVRAEWQKDGELIVKRANVLVPRREERDAVAKLALSMLRDAYGAPADARVTVTKVEGA